MYIFGDPSPFLNQINQICCLTTDPFRLKRMQATLKSKGVPGSFHLLQPIISSGRLIHELSQSDGVWLGDIGTADYFSNFTRHQLKRNTVFGSAAAFEPFGQSIKGLGLVDLIIGNRVTVFSTVVAQRHTMGLYLRTPTTTVITDGLGLMSVVTGSVVVIDAYLLDHRSKLIALNPQAAVELYAGDNFDFFTLEHITAPRYYVA